MSRSPWTVSRTPGRDSSASRSCTAIRCVSRPTRASSSVTREPSWGSFDAATHRCSAARNSGPV
ncbi:MULTISPECIES: CxxxxCH/CxxCH domain-containing protein [unclassified Streptomyces]|uniref:CxxxxCH/CxxCH domain-containing protein n=1 Tax=unclassified Streptomyces TaxID=2593676 RepID=UPI0033E7DBDC